MNTILLTSIFVRVLAFVWSLVLVKQTRDWRMGFLSLMIALMAIRQMFTFWSARESGTLNLSMQLSELPGLAVSIMGLLAIYFLRRILSGHDEAITDARSSETKYKDTVNSLPQVYVEADLDGRINLLNQAGKEKFVNTRSGKQKALTVSDLVIEEDRPRALVNTKDVLAGKNKGPNRYQFQNQDGSTFPALVYSAPVTHDSEVIGIRGIIVDISELAEAELRLNEAQSIARLGSWIYFLKEGRISFSHEITRIWELEPGISEATVDVFLQRIHPDDFAWAQHQTRMAVEKSESIDITYRLLFDDGRIKHVKEISRSFKEESGEVTRVVGTMQDVSTQVQTQHNLVDSEARFRGIFEQVPVGVALLSSGTGEVTRINPAYLNMLGYQPEELSELDFIYRITHPEDKKMEKKLMAKFRAGETLDFNIDKRYINSQGETIWVNLTVATIDSFKDETQSREYIAVAQNITERKKTESELRKLSQGIEASSSSVTITDTNGIIEYVNLRFSEITGYLPEDVIGRHIHMMRSGETPDYVYDELWQTVLEGQVWKGELRDRKKDGSLYWNRVSLAGVRDEKGQITHIIGNQDDVTHEFELSEKINFQARHDSLTGLVNRDEFERRAERLLSTIRQDKTEHALCFMDLDQFKIINDTCGHTAGDEMMRQLSKALQKVVRKRDTLARLGGDEFGVLMEHCSPDHAHRVATTLQNVIQEHQFSWQGHVFRVGVSIGLVEINERFSSLTDLMKKADAACYMAKDLGRNRIHVYHDDDTSIAERHGEMQWVARIYKALEEERFQLFAQSIVSLNNHREKHYELLIRMINEDGQLVPPGAFLPAAERYNVIEMLDSWVIEHTLEVLAANPQFLSQISFVSINLSGQSLNKKNFLDFIVSKLESSGITGCKICFEITETTAILNLTAANVFISTLKQLGCRFALDDFGSGLSSFGYLKNLPVDYLKIYGMFVKDILHDPIDRAMVKSINEIGHVMGKQTIAEFVENDEIKTMLHEIGVNYAQGYGIDKPQPLEYLVKRITNESV